MHSFSRDEIEYPIVDIQVSDVSPDLLDGFLAERRKQICARSLVAVCAALRYHAIVYGACPVPAAAYRTPIT